MEDQIILIDKPADISSFGVVAKVRGYLRNAFGHKVKVGHTGTLDPFATGLLILLSGKMTKKSSDFLKLDKVYEATLKLGYTSTTGDPEGEITSIAFSEPSEAFLQEKLSDSLSLSDSDEDAVRKKIAISLVEDLPEVTTEDEGASPVTTGASDPCPKLSDVQSSLNSFIGTISQTPPRFSAIKINGRRAYKLAREGKDFEVPARQVKIYSIDILDYSYPELKIRVHCSSGTYIRTLAEDIGKKLGTGAYLIALRRTKIGDYSIENSHPLSDFLPKSSET